MSTYRRLATAEQNDSAASTNSNSARNDDTPPARSRQERISDKLHALAWVIAACAIATHTKMLRTVLADGRILRPILHASLALFSADAVLAAYLVCYLPFRFPVSSVHGTPASSPAFWEAYCPRVIPAMTACGVLGSFLLVRACYPVWGFLTPFLLGAVALGMFFGLHFVPWC